jgi:hypothetical protein
MSDYKLTINPRNIYVELNTKPGRRRTKLGRLFNALWHEHVFSVC